MNQNNKNLVDDKVYRLLFENSEDAIFLMSENRFVDCNPATLKMFNCLRHEILEETPIIFSPEQQPDGSLSCEKAMIKINAALSGKPQMFEWLHMTLDGQEFDAEVCLKSITLNKKPHLLAFVKDISKRKHAEKAMEVYRKQTLLQNNSLKLVNQFSANIKTNQAPKEIAKNCIEILSVITNTQLISVYFFNEGESYVELAASDGYDQKTIESNQILPIKNSLSGTAIRENKIQVSHDVTTDRRLNYSVSSDLKKLSIVTICVAPLYYQGRTYGTVNVAYKDYHSFSEMEKETITVVANTLAHALANSKQIRDFEYLAHHDSLTKLPNRLSYHHDFSNRPNLKSDLSALMLFDLNGFKEVNDTLGHHIGDILLKQIGSRLSDVFIDNATNIYRLGGDEFILLFHGIVELSQIKLKAQALLKEIRRPYDVDHMKLEIDASIGISIYPKDGENSHEILRSADVAMYEAKNSGKGFAIYDENNDKNSIARLSLMTELSHALSNDELVLHYQPKINCDSGGIIGFEALIRWQHPKHGLLFPDTFIPLAEMSEVIHPLTEKIFLIAIEQQQKWIKNGCLCGVAINLSVRNLTTNRFVNFLQEYLSQNNLDASLVEFEVTETALMQDIESAMRLLNKITDLGFKVSIDDFGTGYSSLSHLRKMPINALKIDREFVKELQHNEQDSIIVSSIIGLAHNLNLTVIAEGVETDTHRSILASLSCDQLQGYGVCRPKPWKELLVWIENYTKVTGRHCGV